MRYLILFIVLSAPPALQANTISLPWEDFKHLYDAQLMASLSDQSTSPFYTRQSTEYILNISKHRAQGKIKITGEWVQGDIRPIPLLNGDTTITQIIETKHGKLIQHEGRLCLLPEAGKTFSVQFETLYRIKQDEQSLFVDFQPIAGITNRLQLNLSDQVQLVDHPGVAQSDLTFYFQNPENNKIRFESKKNRHHQARFEQISELRVENNQAIARTWVKKIDPTNTHQFSLTLPKQYQWLASSLKPNQIDASDKDAILIQTDEPIFWVDYAITDRLTDTITFLPLTIKQAYSTHKLIIAGSKQGKLKLQNPADVTQMSFHHLDALWHPHITPTKHFYRIQAAQPVQLSFEQYQTLATPPTVLDKIEFFTSVDDSGKMLSTLRLLLPQHYGAHFQFTPPEQAKIWSLKVNGEKESIYQLPSGEWAVPLSRRQTSFVEISFLQQTEALSLQGRLPISIPQLSIAAKHFYYTLAIPTRIQLTQVEGDIHPFDVKTQVVPGTLLGHPHFFQRALYQGESFNLAFHYREPIE